MTGLSDIFAAHRNHLTDMEINPIMVRAQGGGVAAVEVRLVHKRKKRKPGYESMSFSAESETRRPVMLYS
jgi:hypothetical protein